MSSVSFTLEVVKDDRNGGTKDRRIESRNDEDAGEWWRYRKNNEHEGVKVTK